MVILVYPPAESVVVRLTDDGSPEEVIDPVGITVASVTEDPLQQRSFVLVTFVSGDVGGVNCSERCW